MSPYCLFLLKRSDNKSSSGDYLFEPSKVVILEDLIPRSLKTQVYRAMLDSLASEHGARMVAMDKATENAGELLGALAFGLQPSSSGSDYSRDF